MDGYVSLPQPPSQPAPVSSSACDCGCIASFCLHCLQRLVVVVVAQIAAIVLIDPLRYFPKIAADVPAAL